VSGVAEALEDNDSDEDEVNELTLGRTRLALILTGCTTCTGRIHLREVIPLHESGSTVIHMNLMVLRSRE
jgi:hypothetical protein